VSVRSISAYSSMNRQSHNDLDGTSYHEFETSTQDQTTFWSQELDLFGKYGKSDWQTGVFLSHFDDQAGGVPGIGDFILPSLIGYNTFYDNFETTKSVGVFVHDIYHVTDALSLAGGVRWSQDKRTIIPEDKALSLADLSTVVACLDSAYGGTLQNNCVGPKLYHTDNGTSFDLSVSYQFTDELLGYTKFSRGYKAGNFNTNGAYTPYQPEFVNEYELGVKSEWLDRRVLVNLATYYIRYTNIQRTVVVAEPNGTTGNATTNAAKAHIVGLELETIFKPDLNWELGFNYAYTDPSYDSFLSATSTPGVYVDQSGEAWEVARNTGSVYAQYGFDVGAGDRIRTRIDWSWQSDIVFAAYSDLYPNEAIMRQNDYGLVNGRISYDFHPWNTNTSIAVYSTNMLGKQYYVGATSLRAVGTSFITPGPPRFIGIEISTKFGGG
jgi:iron complex outermembrane receptor protein